MSKIEGDNHNNDSGMSNNFAIVTESAQSTNFFYRKLNTPKVL